MRKFVIVFALFLLLFSSQFILAEDVNDPVKSWRSPFNEEEMGVLKYALEAANLSIEDLGFEKKALSDIYRLSTIDKMLDEPLYCSSLSDETGKTFYSAYKQPHIAVARIAKFLDVEASAPAGAKHGMNVGKVIHSRYPNFDIQNLAQKLSIFPKDFRVAVEQILIACTISSETMKKALAKLSNEELGIAMSVLPQWATESDDINLAPAWKDSAKDMDGGKILEFANKIDLALVSQSAWLLSHAVRQSSDTLKKLVTDSPSTYNKLITEKLNINTPFGLMIIAPTGENTYTEDAAIIIDLGGDDYYKNGCSTAIAQSPQENLSGRRHISVLIDLAGDDRYFPKNGYGCATGIGGVAILLDAGGEDFYKSGHISCGAGILGAGILIDDSGDDIYKGDSFTQGAGYFGFGLLAEGSGGDMYRAAKFAQGFGYVKGVGIIVDDAGVDQYFAGGKYLHIPLLPTNYQSLSQGCGFGMRGLRASGGVGIICDAAGNDTYVAEVYGQATSYWFAAGILVDGGGNDNYITTQYSVGAGIHLAAGVLLDREGNDHYYCKNGVGIGGSHDWSVGVLIDLGGDDYYQGAGAAQGTGHTNGVGILLDAGSGRDAYSGITTSILQGGGSERRNTASIGVLIDMGGNDNYSSGLENGELRVKGVYGVAYDVPDPPKEDKKK